MPDPHEHDQTATLKAEVLSLRRQVSQLSERKQARSTINEQLERLDDQHTSEERKLRAAYRERSEQIADAIEAAGDMRDKGIDLVRESTTMRGDKQGNAMQDQARTDLRRLYKERDHLSRDHEIEREQLYNAYIDARKQLSLRDKQLQQRPESRLVGDFRPSVATVKPTLTQTIWSHHNQLKG